MQPTSTDCEAIVPKIPDLRRYARALTNSADHADDLVQDTLERAIMHFDQFRSGTNLRAWLFAILRNSLRDQYRRSVRRGPEIPIEKIEHKLHSRAEQADQLQMRDVMRAFSRLSDEHQEVLTLVGVEDMPYEQVATLLGIEIGTVKSRVSRARSRLRHERDVLERAARPIDRKVPRRGRQREQTRQRGRARPPRTALARRSAQVGGRP